MKRILYLIAIPFLMGAACSSKENTTPTEPSAPATPTGITLKGSTESSLTFQWGDMKADSYDWQLQKDGSSVNSGSTRNRNVVISDLSAGTTYKFGVRSLKGEERSSWAYLEAKTTGSSTPDPGPTPSVDYQSFQIPAVEEADGKARAFPGAEGGGMWTTGGRGGKVIHVTNLNDSGDGSLRAAINQKGARTVVFDVAGIIELNSKLEIKNGDITIAGQTAPGDGICLKNYTLHIKASNVIVRFIRCRMGDEKSAEDDAMNLNAGSDNISDVIVDHCSLSWSTDECGSFYGMNNFTLQWCILSESLRNSIHDKGKHGYGGLWGGANATYHHNLLAHHDSRNARLDHDYLSLLKGPVSLVNNVIYNWGDNSTYGGESANNNNEFRKYNIVNNYYKPGPATAAGKIRFIDPWTESCSNCTKKTGVSTIVPGHFYMDGNVMEGYTALSANNWAGTTAKDEVIATIKAASAFTYAPLATSFTKHTAAKAFDAVTHYSGASLHRDAVDQRVCRETEDGTYTYTGSKGSTGGFIDTQSDAGGWPAYTATSTSSIPDWVGDPNAFTLDPKKRYTNLEMYLHYLVKDVVAGGNQGGTYSQF